MKITFAIGWLIIISVFSSAAFAAEEKDPFFPAGPRSVGSASVPQESNWGRDPFARPFEGKPQAAGPGTAARGLTGIICSKKNCIAIIGGETYRVGSMVNGQKLVDIRRRSVMLMSSSGSREEMFLEDFSMRK